MNTIAPLWQTGTLAPRKLAAHLFTLLFLAAWGALSLVAPSYLLPSPLQIGQRRSPRKR